MAETRHIYIDTDNKLSIRHHSVDYTPQHGQSRVKVIYSGVNSADILHGVVVGFNDHIAGYEASGVVIAVGSESPFVVGDLVAGSNYPGKDRPAYSGAHQDFMIAQSAAMWWKIPPHMALTHAAGMTIMVRTAADGLFNLLEVPFKPLNFHCGEDSQLEAGGPILIWGGASAVGFAAIQLAKAAGLKPIITTASPRNHEQLHKHGADYCIDYNDKDVVDKVRTIVQAHGQTLRYVFDTVGIQKEGYSSPALCEACGTSPSSGLETRFVCRVPVIGNPRWRMVLATRIMPFPNPGPNGITIMYDARPDWDDRMLQTTLWVAKEYGKTFFMMPVDVVKGAEAGVRIIEESAEGKISFKKPAIEHPL